MNTATDTDVQIDIDYASAYRNRATSTCDTAEQQLCQQTCLKADNAQTECTQACQTCDATILTRGKMSEADVVRYQEFFEYKENVFKKRYGIKNKRDVVFQDTQEVQASVVVKSGTTITTDDGTEIELTGLEVKELAFQDVSDAFEREFYGGVEFGLEESSISFSQPVKVIIPIQGKSDGEIINIYVRHTGDEEFGTRGLTQNPDSTCTDGIPSDPGSLATVIDGTATIYTCAASEHGG